MKNNNNQKRNEILFFKVFRNTVILKNIIKQIEIIGENEINNNYEYSKINNENNLKFKEIKSMNWMIKNKQFELLKYKIKSNDEYLEINLNSIYNLFTTKDTSSTSIIIINEIKELLLNFKLLELSKLNLNSELTKELIEFIRIVHEKKENKFKIKTKFQFLDINENYLKNQNKSYKQVLKDKEFNSEEDISQIDNLIMIDLEYLFKCKSNLDNEINQLLSNTLKFIKNEKQAHKLQNEINSILITKSSQNNNKIEKIHKLYSIEFTKICYGSYLNKYDKPNGKIGQIYQCTELYYAFNSFSGNLFKYVIENNDDDDDDGGGNRIVDNTMGGYVVGYFRCSPIDKELESTFLFIKLYTLFENEIYQHYQVDRNLLSFILSLPNDVDYQKAINSVSNDNERFSKVFPEKRNPVLNDFCLYASLGQFYIHDKESVDWIADSTTSNLNIDKINTPIIKYLASIYSVTYTNYQVAEYAEKVLKQYNSALQFSKQFYSTSKVAYEDAFIIAFFKFDIDSIEYINNNIFIDENYSWYKSRFTIDLDSNLTPIIIDQNPTNQTLISFSNYLKKISYKNIHQSLMVSFFKKILDRIEELSDDEDNDDIISCIDMDYLRSESFIHQVTILMKNSIDECSFKKIQFILKYCNHIPLSRYYYYSPTMFKSEGSDSGDLELTDQTSTIYEQLTNCINLFMEIYSRKCRNGYNDDDINFLKGIINHFFQMAIKVKGITIDKINWFYNLITNPTNNNFKPVEIIESLYNSFFYLVAKSQKLAKYIIERPFIYTIFGMEQMSYYTDGCYFLDDSNDYYDISRYLDPNVFTYKYLFKKGNSFDTILLQLIHHLSHLHAFRNNDQISNQFENNYLSKSFNLDLQFLLEIKRIDLFFKKLDFIQSILNGNSKNFQDKIITLEQLNNSFPKSKDNDIRVFKYDEKTFELACKVLDSDQFIKFSKYCSYNSIYDVLPKSLLNNNNQVYYIKKHFKTISNIILKYK